MTCIGCDNPITQTAAWAIMHEDDFNALSLAPIILGPAQFHAAPICGGCFVNPAYRVRPLKAHYALPGQEMMMLNDAGGSEIGA